MNINNLCRKLEFKSGTILYIPPDPFGIYERLAKIFLKAHGDYGIWEKGCRLISNEKVEKIQRVY